MSECLSPCAGNRLRYLFTGFSTATGHNHACACFGHTLGNRAADPTARSCDQRDFTIQSKHWLFTLRVLSFLWLHLYSVRK